MDLQLKGKNALVTGGSKGIGRAIAECFAGEGANVAICARQAGPVAEGTVRALEAKKGVKAWGQAVDVADPKALGGWVESAAKALGGVDALVCNVSALAVGDTGGNLGTVLSRRHDAHGGCGGGRCRGKKTPGKTGWGHPSPSFRASPVSRWISPPAPTAPSRAR